MPRTMSMREMYMQIKEQQSKKPDIWEIYDLELIRITDIIEFFKKTPQNEQTKDNINILEREQSKLKSIIGVN